MPSVWAQAEWAAQEPQLDRWLHSAVSPGPVPGAALALCRGEGRSQVLWFSHAWLCMCTCGYIWNRGRPGCEPLRPHICRRPICVNVCICVHADECVCVCLAACLWMCVMHPHLNFEFAFILVCVLKNMREEDTVPWEVNFLHVLVCDGDTDFLQTPHSSSLLTPELSDVSGCRSHLIPKVKLKLWTELQVSENNFLVEVLKFRWKQTPSENLLTRMDLLFRKISSKYVISCTIQKAQGALQRLLWIPVRKQSTIQTFTECSCVFGVCAYFTEYLLCTIILSPWERGKYIIGSKMATAFEEHTV